MEKLSIRPIRRADLQSLTRLRAEFEAFLQELDQSRKIESSIAFSRRLSRHAFGHGRAFTGLLAVNGRKPVGYVLYHFGYDPDETRGKVVYVIDLYVSCETRRRSIGTHLMKSVAAVCRREGAISIYFLAWARNTGVFPFYKGLGAVNNPDLILFNWERKNWGSGARTKPDPVVRRGKKGSITSR
jgi:ribosomal protein S18 acetylase RimI-like enzyme